MMHAEIYFIRINTEDGFGFACMKAAYVSGVTGRMDYGNGSQVKIVAEGEQVKVADFIQWIKTNVLESSHLRYDTTMNYSGRYDEFNIYFDSAEYLNFPKCNTPNQ